MIPEAEPRTLETDLARFGLACRCLGWLFLEPPSAENTALLLEAERRGGWMLDCDDVPTRTGLGQLRSAQDNLAALTADYNRLFVGPGPLLAPPWESAQRSVDRLLFGPPTLEVRAWFARFGLEAPNRGREPDDHLGLELGFLAHLCERAQAVMATDPAALAELLRAMNEFLDQHLLLWAPNCLEQILGGARTLYYQGLANLTLGCLRQAAQAFRGDRH